MIPARVTKKDLEQEATDTIITQDFLHNSITRIQSPSGIRKPFLTKPKSDRKRR